MTAVFDNGFQRDLGHSTDEPFSRGVVFRIEPSQDGTGGTVQQIWEYGRERGAELYAPVISDVDVGPVTGNRFVMPGSYTTSPDGTPGGAAKVVEVRPSDGQVVFEAHMSMRGKREWGDDMCYRQERFCIAGACP